MAARLNRMHQDSIREKIRAAQLVLALEKHVLDDKKMSMSAVTAALGLLRKCVPDLQTTTVQDPDGNPVPIVQVTFGEPAGRPS